MMQRKSLRDPKRRPTHPGAILREDVLPALNLNITEAAAMLGVSRSALSRVLSERAAISVMMALRLERWLGVKNGGRADLWLLMSKEHYLWKLAHQRKKHG